MKFIFAICCMISSGLANANQISEANNRFTPDVYTEIAKGESGNILFSPLSAESVLALLQAGTEGSTAEELAKALYLPVSKEEIQNETKSLLTGLQSSQTTICEIANAAFVQEKFVLSDTFLSVAKDYFLATSQNLDFSQSQEAAQTINKFVEDHTNNLIKNLVSPNDLSAATVLVLVNALRFKGNWSMPFSQSNTKKATFYTPTEEIQVDTLHNIRKHYNYFYCSDLDAEFLELPFEGNDASLVIALPKDRNGLADLETHILEMSTSEIPFQSTYLNVALPKFKFEYKIDFTQVLSQLGVTKIFDPAQADLSGIAGKKGDLVVSKVFQKAFVDLNEGGVEAAAATFVGIVTTAVVSPEPKDFVVDRPFMFLLKNQKTIIFAGRVVEPTY